MAVLAWRRPSRREPAGAAAGTASPTGSRSSRRPTSPTATRRRREPITSGRRGRATSSPTTPATPTAWSRSTSSAGRPTSRRSWARTAGIATRRRSRRPTASCPRTRSIPDAVYADQSDLYRVQKEAVARGAKHLFIVWFDGLDWPTTQAAAIVKTGKVYTEGKGSGLIFQDYDAGGTAQYGFVVTSPTHDKNTPDVDTQTVVDPADEPGRRLRRADRRARTPGRSARSARRPLATSRGSRPTRPTRRACRPSAASCTPTPTHRRAPPR